MGSALLHTDEIALEDLVPPVVVRLGGALLVAAGLFAGAAGVQVLALFEGVAPTVLALPVLAVALASVIVAPFAYDGRGWAVIAGTGLALAVALVALPWIAYATLALAFAPSLFLAFLTASAALSVLPFGIRPALRLTSLRRALRS